MENTEINLEDIILAPSNHSKNQATKRKYSRQMQLSAFIVLYPKPRGFYLMSLFNQVKILKVETMQAIMCVIQI